MILRRDEPGKGIREDRPIARHRDGRGHGAALLGLRPRSARLPQDPVSRAPGAGPLGGPGRRESDEQVVPALVARLDDEDPVVRLAANEELRKRTGRDFGYVPWASDEERAGAIARWRAVDGGTAHARRRDPADGAAAASRRRPHRKPRAGGTRRRRARDPARRAPLHTTAHGERPLMIATPETAPASPALLRPVGWVGRSVLAFDLLPRRGGPAVARDRRVDAPPLAMPGNSGCPASSGRCSGSSPGCSPWASRWSAWSTSRWGPSWRCRATTAARSSTGPARSWAWGCCGIWAGS